MGNEAWLHTGIMLSAAIIGLCIGSFTDSGGIAASLIEPFLMLMLFLVFLSIDLGRFRESFANVGFLSSAVLINFVWTPILAFVLGILFFNGSIDLRIGLMMLLVTPCTDWYLVFTAVSKGNVNLSSTLLPINLALQILLMPVYLLVFMGESADFDTISMLEDMAFVLLIPFFAALTVKLLSPRISAVDRLRNAMNDRCDNLQLFFLSLHEQIGEHLRIAEVIAVQKAEILSCDSGNTEGTGSRNAFVLFLIDVKKALRMTGDE